MKLLEFGSAILAVNGFTWIIGRARPAMVTLSHGSRNGEGLVRARVKVELVSALTSEPRNLILLESPLSLRTTRYLNTTFWTAYAHRLPRTSSKCKSDI